MSHHITVKRRIMKKLFNRLVMRYLNPVRCRKCGELLYRKMERNRGISTACRKRELKHMKEQEDGTEQYFFTNPLVIQPSPYFHNIGDILKHSAYNDHCNIWSGTYDAPRSVKVGLLGVGK